MTQYQTEADFQDSVIELAMWTGWMVVLFLSPPELEGHPPDMTLLEETWRLLGYVTNGAALYWWTRFPSPTWWRYANAATRFLCVPGKRGTRFTKPNYVFLPFVTGCSSGRIAP